MSKSTKRIIQLSALAAMLIVVVLLGILVDNGGVVQCTCHNNVECELCGGFGSYEVENRYYSTFVALVPPIVAIALALITKEVYSSLFVGIVLGALFASNYSFAGTLDFVTNDGLITTVSDTAGIFIFLVVLGIVVALLNRAGGAQAFGKWAEEHIKTKVGAMLATFALGVLIFIDDYFNCLTVGAVMRPLTDKHKISRAKLAFIIDATAAPICMIAPVSSWAAAVSGYVDKNLMSGIELFVRAIPFNFYSLLTIAFVVTIAILGFDYGKMSGYEIKATAGDLVGGGAEGQQDAAPETTRGSVIDLLVPIIALITFCVLGLLYVGGYFTEGEYQWDFIGAFSQTNATIGLPWGSLVALVIILGYYFARRVITPNEAMKCIPQGFIAMVPAILILTFATALKNMTGLLGAKYFVANLMDGAAADLAAFLPAIIFLVACFLAFSTGTSWGTFGILIPIVTYLFTNDAMTMNLLIVCVSACLAGAVCGDHCSPISDTTIMASAGAQCNHLVHVQTQLPYALTVAAVSFVSYVIAGFLPYAWISLPIAVALMVGAIFGLRYYMNRKNGTCQVAEQ